MTDPTSIPVPAAFAPAFVAAMGNSMQSFLSLCSKSPELMALLTLCQQNSITVGVPGGGTFS